MTFMKVPNLTSINAPMEFFGFGNYINAFKDTKFWAALWLTVRYVLACVLLVNVIGFFLGYLVTSGIKGQNVYRSALFTPNLIGGLVMGYIWQFIFMFSLPAVGKWLDIEMLKLQWLGDANKAFLALVIVTIWQMSGYMMLIFIAGFVSLPKDVLEAASIDGMNAWQRMRFITLPLMVPAFVVTIFLTLRNCFMVYDINMALTRGEPYGSTKMVSMHIVNKAFSESKYALGQAEAIILFLIVATISVIQVNLGKKREVEA
jgi:raffinose/stachyose/melibiose transport system permease protein